MKKCYVKKKDIDQKLQTVDGQIKNIHEIISSLEVKRKNRVQLVEESKVRLSDLGEQINALERKSLSLESQKEFIEKLHTQYQDIPDPIIEGRLIIQTPPSDHHTGILGKVKEVRALNVFSSCSLIFPLDNSMDCLIFVKRSRFSSKVH